MTSKFVPFEMCNERSTDIKNLIVINSTKIDKIIDNHLVHMDDKIDVLSEEVSALKAEVKLLVAQNQTYMRYALWIIFGLMVAAFGMDVLKVIGVI